MEARTLIAEYIGEVMAERESKTRLQEYSRDPSCHNYYMFRVSKDHVIDAGPCGNVSRFINHSCDPNCVSQKWTVCEVREGVRRWI